MGGSIAAALGMGLAFAAEFLDGTVRSIGGFEARTGLRPLVVIPYIRTVEETRQRRRRKLLIVAGMVLAIAAALASIHWFYTPLDVIYYRIVELF